VSKLHGTEVVIPDIRAGFSGVIAAAVADGPSLLHGMHHVERGYNRPFETFEALGLRLRRS
jgi:UDP-N-acetylglucosamine 1-carboxyvinyltransferase